MCSASVQAAREPFISSLLVIAWNKHEWTLEGILFQPQKDVKTPFFKFRSTDVNLLLSCGLFVGQNSALWLVRSPVNQLTRELI